MGFVAFAAPNARADVPRTMAASAYVLVSPSGMPPSQDQQRCWKGVPTGASGIGSVRMVEPRP
jgi:hypothetical protein